MFSILLMKVSIAAEGLDEMVLPNDIDLLNPPAELEKRRHKLKRLVQSPNSFFMDVKCQGCFNITTVFSHSQLLWFAETARPFCASRLAGVQGSPRAALSDEKAIEPICALFFLSLDKSLRSLESNLYASFNTMLF
ncbi:unnamed protein product [Musa acuminata subsp. malaccensis]|uniref:(wild Malaysian banana) hypothetical protein n=1 Tax=Musa acuminata subsp. malaccensis TaxID=214687 RepID=A0A804KVE9_MUSAM|nr:unnamed protein product [Musa acuminata subsp. malaccensis]